VYKIFLVSRRKPWQDIVCIVFGILDAIGLILTLVGRFVDQSCCTPLICK